jgi:hypothetical protein
MHAGQVSDRKTQQRQSFLQLCSCRCYLLLLLLLLLGCTIRTPNLTFCCAPCKYDSFCFRQAHMLLPTCCPTSLSLPRPVHATNYPLSTIQPNACVLQRQ